MLMLLIGSLEVQSPIVGAALRLLHLHGTRRVAGRRLEAASLILALVIRVAELLLLLLVSLLAEFPFGFFVLSLQLFEFHLKGAKFSTGKLQG